MTLTWSKEKVAAWWLAWIDDLETTTAPQAKCALWRRNLDLESMATIGYCCLGRGCVVTERPEFGGAWISGQSTMPSFGFPVGESGSVGFPAEFLKLVGMSDAFQRRLQTLNDDRDWTFREIANVVRAYALTNNLIPEPV